MGRKRDTKELKQRRLGAARDLKRGNTQADVARECDVTRSTISLWAQQDGGSGKQALRRRSLGHPAALGETERRKLAQKLKREALAAGLVTEV